MALANTVPGDQYTGLDRFGRVVDQRWIVTANGTHTDRFQYGYDRDSNALYRNNLVNTAFGELYHASGAGNGYDNLNQLSGFLRGVLSASGGSGTPLDTISSPSTTVSYSPDALGNFSSIVTNGTTQTRSANQQNEITAISGATTPTYDTNGNLTKDETGQTYTYDAWNRLVQVKNSGGTTIASYKYDGTDRRIQETHSGTTTDLYFSSSWQVLEERTGGVSTATAQYVWSAIYLDALVLRDRSTQNNGTLDERLWVQQDTNGSVTAVINSSGTVVERYALDAFGQVIYLNASFSSISGSAYGWVYIYQALRLDTVTGNYWARRRDYRPSIQHWLQVDPRRLEPDSNWYRFVNNNPTNWIDPFGLSATGTNPIIFDLPKEVYDEVIEELGKMLLKEAGQQFIRDAFMKEIGGTGNTGDNQGANINSNGRFDNWSASSFGMANGMWDKMVDAEKEVTNTLTKKGFKNIDVKNWKLIIDWHIIDADTSPRKGLVTYQVNMFLHVECTTPGGSKITKDVRGFSRSSSFQTDELKERLIHLTDPDPDHPDPAKNRRPPRQPPLPRLPVPKIIK